MKLILVRHGETEWIRQKRYQGRADIGLNQTGLTQARAVGKFLKSEKPVAIFSSALKRARQTAKFVVQQNRSKLHLQIDKSLNEISFGKWEGMAHAAARVKFPKSVRRFYKSMANSQPDGGESLQSLKNRVGRFLKAFFRAYGDGGETAIVVAHGGTIRMMMVHILGIPLRVFWNFRIDPASVTILNVNSKRNEAVLLNSCSHLKH